MTDIFEKLVEMDREYHRMSMERAEQYDRQMAALLKKIARREFWTLALVLGIIAFDVLVLAGIYIYFCWPVVASAR